MKSPTTKRPLGRTIQSGEIDPYTAKRVFAHIGLDASKKAAQNMRESLDWNFNSDTKVLYDCAMEVIHYAYPDFETDFIPTS